MVQLHSVETKLLQLLASQEHPTEDPALTRSILTLNKNYEDTQERYTGRKKEKGRGERAEEAREGKCTRIVSFVPSSPSHSVNLSAADDKASFPGARTQAWDEAKPKMSYGKGGDITRAVINF